MRRYFGRKLPIYALTFFVAATIDWLIPRFMPGDPIQSLLSRSHVTPEALPALQAYYQNLFGLDKPLPSSTSRSGRCSRRATSGERLPASGSPVTKVIMDALPYTLALLVPAILLSWWAGNKFGALAARRQFPRQRRPADRLHPERDALHVARDPHRVGLRIRARLVPAGRGLRFSLEPALSLTFAAACSRTGSCRSCRCSWSCSAAGRSGCGT